MGGDEKKKLSHQEGQCFWPFFCPLWKALAKLNIYLQCFFESFIRRLWAPAQSTVIHMDINTSKPETPHLQKWIYHLNSSCSPTVLRCSTEQLESILNFLFRIKNRSILLKDFDYIYLFILLFKLLSSSEVNRTVIPALPSGVLQWSSQLRWN